MKCVKIRGRDQGEGKRGGTESKGWGKEIETESKTEFMKNGGLFNL